MTPRVSFGGSYVFKIVISQNHSLLFGVGVLCRILYSVISYLYGSCSRLEKRELFFLLSFTCNYVVYVRRIPFSLGALNGLCY